MFHADGQTDGQTDMTKIIDDFRNSVNAPKTFFRPFLVEAEKKAEANMKTY